MKLKKSNLIIDNCMSIPYIEHYIKLIGVPIARSLHHRQATESNQSKKIILPRIRIVIFMVIFERIKWSIDLKKKTFQFQAMFIFMVTQKIHGTRKLILSLVSYRKLEFNHCQALRVGSRQQRINLISISKVNSFNIESTPLLRSIA